MKTLVLLLGALVLGAVIAGGAMVVLQSDSATATQAANTPAAASRSTAEVVRETLRATEEFDATLGYDEEGTLLVGLSGTVTALPEEGEILEAGDVVVELDGDRRVVLLDGERPAWRTMREGTKGKDVRQLEVALKDLGYRGEAFKPDQEFGEATTAAMKDWQEDLDVATDGVADLGEVIFTDGPVRIEELEVTLGQTVRPGSRLAVTTSGTRVVNLDLEADRQDIVAVGDAVSVELPDGEVTGGQVARIGTVAVEDPSGGDPTVPVTISLDDPAATGDLDGAPVTVLVTRETREGVLTVPVDALLALQEGGYAVELVDGSGGSRLAGVDLGLFADGRVQVEGGLAAGDHVVVPR